MLLLPLLRFPFLLFLFENLNKCIAYGEFFLKVFFSLCNSATTLERMNNYPMLSHRAQVKPSGIRCSLLLVAPVLIFLVDCIQSKPASLSILWQTGCCSNLNPMLSHSAQVRPFGMQCSLFLITPVLVFLVDCIQSMPASLSVLRQIGCCSNLSAQLGMLYYSLLLRLYVYLVFFRTHPLETG